MRGGTTLKVPWAIAVPLVKRDLIPVARLSSRTFVPSDVEPAVLTVVAGRVDGTAERPQLLPLEQLAIELYRGEKNLGRLALVRDLLPGRYSFGITGRGPGGKRLPPGTTPPPHRHTDRRGCDRRADRPVHDLMRAQSGVVADATRAVDGSPVACREGYSRHVVSDGVHA